MPRIATPRLNLVPGTIEQLHAELEGHAAFARALGVSVPPGWPPDLYDADAVRWTIRRLERERGQAIEEPFGFYYFVLRDEQMLIGAGGFRGGPDEHGSVELGYAVVREYQRRGLASEAVRGWLAFAFADPRVRCVTAQTLEGLTASIGVLEKNGFTLGGAGTDTDVPDGAKVIRYEIRREDY